MKSLKIVIRVDGGHKIGMGHIYRSLNLANYLKNRGHKIIFLIKNPSTRKFIPIQYDCYQLDSNNYNKELIIKIRPDIIVIDKLRESSEILQIFKKNNFKTIAIDYIGKNKKLIDFGINILFPISGIKNNKSNSSLKYAILKKSFSKSQPIKIRKKIKSILILQGGADTRCFIPIIIESLNKVKEDFSITAVLGPSFTGWNELKKIQNKNRKSLKTLQSVKNMSTVMSNHDIAITGGGMSLIELSRLGVPSIIVCGEPFENETASTMESNGFGINLGFRSNPSKTGIAEATGKLINNYSLRRKMNRLGRKLVDGKGLERVTRMISTVAKQN